MALRKAVLTEALDLFKDGFRKILLIPALAHAIDDTVVVLLQATLALPRSHRAPELIRFTRRETRREDRDLHHLLLENRDAQRATERNLQCVARVGDRLEPLSPAKIRVHCAALNRPRPNNGYLDHEVVERPGLQPWQHRHLRPGLNLEDADRIRLRNHLVGDRVLDGDVLHLEALAALLGHDIERAANRR
ncbi:hypothetical protein AWB81_08130 [Caballeronia arationis]|nr:hypothetical protein AWB81_08130 [Caballeronia arationis]